MWLLELAANYYDLSTFPNGETKRALQRQLKKPTNKKKQVDNKSSARSTPTSEKPPPKKKAN
jgi:pre-mRNA-splicing factor ATP-dependent RNA helicase DHX15/PRP43